MLEQMANAGGSPNSVEVVSSIPTDVAQEDNQNKEAEVQVMVHNDSPKVSDEHEKKQDDEEDANVKKQLLDDEAFLGSVEIDDIPIDVDDGSLQKQQEKKKQDEQEDEVMQQQEVEEVLDNNLNEAQADLQTKQEVFVHEILDDDSVKQDLEEGEISDIPGGAQQV